MHGFLCTNEQISIPELKKYLLEYLPNHMIPNTFSFINKLPFTPNGKIDRKALKTYPISESSIVPNTYVPARNETEQILLDSISRKLMASNMGIDSSIFDYGADSLLIINILTDLFQYNFNLKVDDFYSHPTVRELYDSVLSRVGLEEELDVHNLGKTNRLVKKFDINTPIPVEVNKQNILITGATGFLGSHILANILDNPNAYQKIYCIIRSKNGMTPMDRLLRKMNFYFGEKYHDKILSKISIIDSDISSDNFNMSPLYVDKIDSVIHCAANVKHYGYYEQFHNTNIIGTKNIIQLCKKFNCKLHYISTMSVSGNYLITQTVDNNITFDEQTFYINQQFDQNVYAKSKLLAEKLIIDEISSGLSACIYRVGDLTGRYSDGKFQENINENAIYLRLKSILSISAIPDSIATNLLEFTPVDYAAMAICKIVLSGCSNRIFHIYNPNMIRTFDLVSYINRNDYHINVIPFNSFIDYVKNISVNETTQHNISGIINDFTSNNDMIYNYTIKADNTITNNYLKSLGFIWPDTDFDYIQKLIVYMKSVSFI